MVRALATTAVTAHYGAAELKHLSHRFWLSGLTLSIALHALVILAYYYAGDRDAIIQVTPYHPRGPVDVLPPPLPGTPSLPGPSAGRAPRTGLGMPVPVAIEPVEVEEAATLPEEIGSTGTFSSGGGVAGGGEASGSDGPVSIEEPPPVFVPVEKFPVVLTRVEPVYPETALRAGLEGRVWVKIWVNKEGRVRDVVLVRSDNEIFNESALAAARQFVFSPATMGTGPVAVWVSVPFRFRLTGH